MPQSLKLIKPRLFHQITMPQSLNLFSTCLVFPSSSIAIIRQYAERRKILSAESTKNKTETLPPKGLKILEAFSASGLRSIRYAKEIVSYDDEAEPLVAEIVSNDISKKAVERIEFNIKQNEVGHIVKANHAGER